jgi:hypothetical protein
MTIDEVPEMRYSMFVNRDLLFVNIQSSITILLSSVIF